MRPALLLCAACLVGGCSRQAPEPAAARAAAADEAGGRLRLLAFAAPDGDSPTDREIVRAKEAIGHNPGKADLYVVLGRAWVRKARDAGKPFLYTHADAAAELALRRDPQNRLAHELRGLVLLNDHRFEEARVLGASLVSRFPDDPSAHGLLSDALLELGRVDEASEAAQRMMDLKPNLPSYSRASYLLWLRGDVAKAKEAARLAIDSGLDTRDLEPQAWVIVQAAMMFWNEGDLEGAEAGFDRALQNVPDFPPALVGKARVLLARDDAAGAARLLDRAAKKSELIETVWLLGEARAAAGDAAGAAQAFARLEARGRALDPRTFAYYLACKRKDTALAVDLGEAERKVRDDLYTEDVRAWALFRAGRLSEARKASERALALGTRDARLLFHAGAIRIAAGETRKGRDLVARALALNPHFEPDGAAEAQRLLRPELRAGASSGRNGG